MNSEKIKEEAIKYAADLLDNDKLPSLPVVFEAGALSDVAKEYWFAQFQSQQKQLSDEEIQELAEKEYPVQTKDEFYLVERDMDWMYEDYYCSVIDNRHNFIKGYKAAQTPPHENL